MITMWVIQTSTSSHRRWWIVDRLVVNVCVDCREDVRGTAVGRFASMRLDVLEFGVT